MTKTFIWVDTCAFYEWPLATCQDTNLSFSMLRVLNQDGEEVEQMTSSVQFGSIWM